ncbi:MAG: phosphatidylinositol-specific phospholipase C/glycerophosphodiester phosphodiesterase family protein [Planctomycetaceae bacterium]
MLSGFLTATLPGSAHGQFEAAPPLSHAHAHNDYLHSRPLLQALHLGFTSVEADIFLVRGRLLVAHSALELSDDRTLEALYLRPLQRIAAANGGFVLPNQHPLTLLVDIKADGARAYTVLDELLAQYDDIISQTRDGVFVQKAVTVIISGDRPSRQILATNPCRSGIDGRLTDLDSRLSMHEMPLISDNWNSHFGYRRGAEFTAADRDKLQKIVKQAHEKGRRVRFWATPEDEVLWKELRFAGVDLIGTDRLEELSRFLQSNSEQPQRQSASESGGTADQ